MESIPLNAVNRAAAVANETAVTTNKGESGGFITDAMTLISPDENLNIDLRARTATPIAQPNFRLSG